MNVEQILKSKGSISVDTIAANAKVAEAAAVLGKKRIGALVVTDGDHVEGIVSERDIVRRLGQTGAACLDVEVGEIMTAKVSTCTPAESANSVLERMTTGRFRHMPVMEGDKMVGLVSIGDVVKARIEDIERENAAMAEMLRG